MVNPKDVTIIIPHYGKTEEQCYSFDRCLESLNETNPGSQILWVPNGQPHFTEDGKLTRFCRHWDGAMIRMTFQGQCKAVNAAVAATNTPWLFVTNDDMVFSKTWWEKLNASISNQMCISPRLVEPRDGAPTFIKYFCGGAGGDFDKQKFEDFVKDNDAPAVVRNGFNLPFLIKRELWDTVGGYDINYDPWGSNGDSDLEYKIKLAGVQPYQSMYSFVYHFGQTSGTFHPDNRSHWDKNWHYFIDKWGFERASTDGGIWQATMEIPMDKLKFKPDWMGKYAKD